ncbi:hypothetical protein DUI87_08693 [Hirundo rustica rustica]|uniref:Uncharacterized protein n=1 Tax=Hirundo rustica rustica TaxID=333673 RepID=A0A3M0L2S4_HIRRU|nr:hypothetical protein DUI87_08693 [Hirundo rustica rustica]
MGWDGTGRDGSGMEDEAVLDRGASFLKHVCDEEEVEGKRNLKEFTSSFFLENDEADRSHHTIYIGVHVPKSYRRRRRHRRRPGHKEKKEKEKISENCSDKSDVENADETSSSILKPLSEYWFHLSFITMVCCVGVSSQRMKLDPRKQSSHVAALE